MAELNDKGIRINKFLSEAGVLSRRKTDEEIEKILNILYKKAGLEDTYSVNMNCIYNKKPDVMGLRRILETYTEYKWEVYTAKYERLLADQRDVREIKSGLLEAVDYNGVAVKLIENGRFVLEGCEELNIPLEGI